MYRVQVGVYKTKQEALEYQAELKSLGVPQSFVVKILK
ncbi:MAG: SPOR domain-containing protein [Bacteroidia bacterium]